MNVVAEKSPAYAQEGPSPGLRLTPRVNTLGAEGGNWPSEAVIKLVTSEPIPWRTRDYIIAIATMWLFCNNTPPIYFKLLYIVN